MADETLVVELANINPITNEFNYALVRLPATSFELEDAMHRARILSERQHYDVSISSCQDVPALCDMRIDGGAKLKELNLLAVKLKLLNTDELTVFNELVKSKIDSDGEIGPSIEELINLTDGLDKVRIVHGISTDEQVGQFVLDNDLMEAFIGASDEVLQCVDRKAIGEQFRESEGGIFHDGSYIPLGAYQPQTEYKSPSYTELEIKNNAVFALEIAEAPVNDSNETESSAEWLYLPIDKKYANDIAEKHNEGCIEDCVYYGFKSVFPSITEDMFDDMQDFGKLNEIAARYVRLDNMNRIKFKAVLEKENPQTLDDVLEISDNLNRYEFSYYATNYEDFAKEYMSKHLPTDFDISIFNDRVMIDVGSAILKRIGGEKTDYGVVSCIDRSLYETITYTDVEQVQEQDNAMGGMMM